MWEIECLSEKKPVSRKSALKMAESKGSLLAKSVQKHLGRSKEKVSPTLFIIKIILN